MADGQQDMLGGFAQATWSASPRLVIVGGLRADAIDVDTAPGGQRDINALSPKGSIAWSGPHALTLRASGYRAQMAEQRPARAGGGGGIV